MQWEPGAESELSRMVVRFGGLRLYAAHPLRNITLKTPMEISLTCGLIRTVLVAWLCLYKVPARLRAIKKADEEDPKKAAQMMLDHFGR